MSQMHSFMDICTQGRHNSIVKCLNHAKMTGNVCNVPNRYGSICIRRATSILPAPCLTCIGYEKQVSKWLQLTAKWNCISSKATGAGQWKSWCQTTESIRIETILATKVFLAPWRTINIAIEIFNDVHPIDKVLLSLSQGTVNVIFLLMRESVWTLTLADLNDHINIPKVRQRSPNSVRCYESGEKAKDAQGETRFVENQARLTNQNAE